MQDFIFVNLASQQSGAKPFDGMAVGTFIDMRGIKATFAAVDLPEYVKNTKASIFSTTDELGNVVGLPIDPRGHYHDEDAAGWIVDVELAATGDKIKFYPRWTQLGIDLISNDLQRFFSPTIDLTNHVIMGGSLTNWPATRSPKGEIMLKPVELSMSDTTMQLTDGSMDELVQKCKQSFYDLFWSIDAYPIEVFPDHLVCILEDKFYNVPYSVDAEGMYTFAQQAEWVEVKLSWIEASMRWVKRLLKRVEKTEQPTAPAVEITEGALSMPETPVQVSPAIAELTTSQIVQLDALIEERTNLRVRELLERKERENKTASFALSVVGKGLPLQADELTAFLSSLSPEQCETAEKIFSRVVETGLIPLTELGHSQVMTGVKPLPELIAISLKSWIDGKGDISEFFKVNAVELGSQSDYDLSDYAPKEG